MSDYGKVEVCPDCGSCGTHCRRDTDARFSCRDCGNLFDEHDERDAERSTEPAHGSAARTLWDADPDLIGGDIDA